MRQTVFQNDAHQLLGGRGHVAKALPKAQQVEGCPSVLATQTGKNLATGTCWP